MSQVISASSIEVLLIAGRGVALLAGFAILAWAFSQWRRAAVSDTQRVFDQLDLVRADLLIMKESMNHATSYNNRYQEEFRRPAAPVSMSNARGYEMAVRMARNGAHKDELIRSCGITNHEAELLIKLHRRDNQGMTGQGMPNQGMSNQSMSTSRAAGASMSRSESVGARFDNEMEQEAMRTALAKDSVLKSRPAKSRLMAIG